MQRDLVERARDGDADAFAELTVAILVPRQGMTIDGTVPGWAFELYKALGAGD
jgi:hypothetical protein